MSLTAFAFTLAAALYTGFQWTIRVLVYPQFALVPPAAFPAYEQAHQRRVSIAVGPLFLALGGGAIVLFAVPPADVSRWWTVVPGAGVAGVLALTALLAVPLHGALAAGFDPAVQRRLLRVDSARLVVAALTTVAGAWITVVSVP